MACSALRRFLNELSISPDRFGNIGASEDEMGRAEHDAHLIVGFVSHSSGQPSDRFHPVSLPQPLLGHPAIGHVGADSGEIQGRPLSSLCISPWSEIHRVRPSGSTIETRNPGRPFLDHTAHRSQPTNSRSSGWTRAMKSW